MSYLGRIGEFTHTGSDGDVFSFEWRIPDFLSLGRGGGDFFCSPIFHCYDGEWFLSIYPEGWQVNPPSGWVGLDLRRLDGDHPETLDVTLGIRGVLGVENRSRETKEFWDGDCVCCWFGFCRRERLYRHASRLMPGNMLVIVVEMRRDDVARDASTQTEESEGDGVTTGEKDISEKRGVEEWQESLLKLLESGEGSDVVMRVRGREFRAHRILLQARSDVFGAMFSHDMVEKQSGVVTMEDCDPETFPDFLKHVYTGCTDRVGAENVFGLYSASDKYDLKALKEKCADFMKKNIAVATFCETITLAVKHDERELIEVAKEFFCANALDVVKTVEWQTFLAENLTVGNELIILSYSQKKQFW